MAIALGAYAFQQDFGGLVVGVLRHQFATEGFGECGGGEIFYLSAGGGVASFESVGKGEKGFDAADDFSLFFRWWQRNRQVAQHRLVD